MFCMLTGRDWTKRLWWNIVHSKLFPPNCASVWFINNASLSFIDIDITTMSTNVKHKFAKVKSMLLSNWLCQLVVIFLGSHVGLAWHEASFSCKKNVFSLC